MFKAKEIANIKADISEIKDVLTEESTEKCKSPHLGSEIDRKLDKSEFERIVGEEKTSTNTLFYYSYLVDWTGNDSVRPKKKTLFERIEAIEDNLARLEKHLGIEYKEETTEFKGYKPIKAKRGRPKGSKKKKKLSTK